MWRCELYADVLLQYPCVTFHIQADDLEQAAAVMYAELAHIQVLLRPGNIVEEFDSRLHFEDGERVRVTRYVPHC
jgi:hypothetical protein